MRTGYLDNMLYHYGNRFGPFDEPLEEKEPFRFRYHPMFYRFHRYIPRRRLWMW